jgi:predicted ATPase
MDWPDAANSTCGAKFFVFTGAQPFDILRMSPVTLHDSLMARLDRLGAAKEVAQVGAVIGSEFSYELLHAVHPIAEENLQRALRTVADAELIYVQGIAPDATYQFKHALIRDVAYEALLKSRRRDLHRLVARTINENSPQLRKRNPRFSRVTGRKPVKPSRRSPNGRERAWPPRRATPSAKHLRVTSRL